MFGVSLILAGSVSLLVAAQSDQTLFDQLQLPTNDPQCCSQALVADFTGADPAQKASPSIDCNTDFGTAFFNCLICSSGKGTLLPPGLFIQDIQGVADDARLLRLESRFSWLCRFRLTGSHHLYHCSQTNSHRQFKHGQQQGVWRLQVGPFFYFKLRSCRHF
ncbi:hypothetical protein B0H13DRAFT_1853052 [Mycena leptocephala]|nr:hypothetical protein B0H13DRAFT_1853052 [Mycena leptocephala]